MQEFWNILTNPLVVSGVLTVMLGWVATWYNNLHKRLKQLEITDRIDDVKYKEIDKFMTDYEKRIKFLSDEMIRNGQRDQDTRERLTEMKENVRDENEKVWKSLTELQHELKLTQENLVKIESTLEFHGDYLKQILEKVK